MLGKQYSTPFVVKQRGGTGTAAAAASSATSGSVGTASCLDLFLERSVPLLPILLRLPVRTSTPDIAPLVTP
jgi:hypothetical protein